MSETAVIERQIAKSADAAHALCGVDLRGQEGTIVGLLGQNGAGKTRNNP
jgi:ABC-type multidrug transport system ATPase subunit